MVHLLAGSLRYICLSGLYTVTFRRRTVSKVIILAYFGSWVSSGLTPEPTTERGCRAQFCRLKLVVTLKLPTDPEFDANKIDDGFTKIT